MPARSEASTGVSTDDTVRTGEPMVGFGGKQAWLAIRDPDPSESADALHGLRERVATVLGLDDLGTVSWRTGMDLAHFTDDRVVLTPPLPGAEDSAWLLVVGRSLALSTVDVDELSDSLDTEVQYFATDRSSQRHRWRRARHGVLVRSFDFLGGDSELLDWQGDPDDAERDAGLPATVDDETALLVGEGDVLRIAGAWSIDPTTLEGRPAPGPLRAAAVTLAG
jgi:hypothetical protein